MSDNINTDVIVRQDTSLMVSEETIDTSSVVPRTQFIRLAENLRDSSSDLPLHLQHLEMLECGDEIRENLISAYANKIEPVVEYMNMDVELLGGVIWEIPPYLSRPANKDDAPVRMPGFYQIRLLTSLEDRNGNYIVLSSSSVGIATVAYYMIKSQGAWLFRTAQTVRFSIGRGGMHQMVKSSESLQELKNLIRKGKEQ